MHLEESQLNDDEFALMEAIRIREGLATIDLAFEWLTKTALREGAKKITGRSRALYAIERK
jgi:hypothetical protein